MKNLLTVFICGMLLSATAFAGDYSQSQNKVDDKMNSPKESTATDGSSGDKSSHSHSNSSSHSHADKGSSSGSESNKSGSPEKGGSSSATQGSSSSGSGAGH